MDTQPISVVDQRILGILRDDARISWRELGDKVHLSATSVAERVRNLERRGVIQGYRATISPAAFGRDLRAVIDIGLPPTMSPEQFETLLLQRPEVAFAAYVSGKADYTVVVDCNGAAGLDLFIRWLKTTAGVSSTESKLVLRPLAG